MEKTKKKRNVIFMEGVENVEIARPSNPFLRISMTGSSWAVLILYIFIKNGPAAAAAAAAVPPPPPPPRSKFFSGFS